MTQERFPIHSPATKLFRVSSNPNAACFAFERLEECLQAATTQMIRIQEASSRAAECINNPPQGASLDEMMAFIENGRRSMIPLKAETHYYFVLWANCGNLLTLLTGLPEFIEAKMIFNSFKSHFEHYTAARNSFEHFHERLPGQRNERKVREVIQSPGAGPSKIFCGFGEGKYRHSDLEWDISPSSLALLVNAVDQTLAAVNTKVDSLLRSEQGAS